MQSVLIVQCFICKASLKCSALYAKCPYYVVLYMQSVLIMQCFICKVSLLCSALYAKRPYNAVLYMQSVLLQATTPSVTARWGPCLVCKLSCLPARRCLVRRCLVSFMFKRIAVQFRYTVSEIHPSRVPSTNCRVGHKNTIADRMIQTSVPGFRGKT